MAKYECTVCGYVYDEDEGDADSGIAPGTKFEDLPDDWVCPVCGAGKGDFEILQVNHKPFFYFLFSLFNYHSSKFDFRDD